MPTSIYKMAPPYCWCEFICHPGRYCIYYRSHSTHCSRGAVPQPFMAWFMPSVGKGGPSISQRAGTITPFDVIAGPDSYIFLVSSGTCHTLDCLMGVFSIQLFVESSFYIHIHTHPFAAHHPSNFRPQAQLPVSAPRKFLENSPRHLLLRSMAYELARTLTELCRSARV